MPFSAATWNVNSIRGSLSRGVRLVERTFARTSWRFRNSRYPPGVSRGPVPGTRLHHRRVRPEKPTNGVALLSRAPLEELSRGIPGMENDPQARAIAGRYGSLSIINVYVPNGQDIGTDKYAYKLAWLKRSPHTLKPGLDPQKPLLVLGDFNICPAGPGRIRPGSFPGSDPVQRTGKSRLTPFARLGPGRRFPPLQHGGAPVFLVGLPDERLPPQPRRAHRPDPGHGSAGRSGRLLHDRQGNSVAGKIQRSHSRPGHLQSRLISKKSLLNPAACRHRESERGELHPHPWEMARSIPRDSMPRSMAGLRLATTTIVLPTSCSGALGCRRSRPRVVVFPPEVDLQHQQLSALGCRTHSKTLAVRNWILPKVSMSISSGGGAGGALTGFFSGGGVEGRGVAPVKDHFAIEGRPSDLKPRFRQPQANGPPLFDKLDGDKIPGIKGVVSLADFSALSFRSPEEKELWEKCFTVEYAGQSTPDNYELDEYDGEDLSIISYTSGTSGFTKGVMIPAHSLLSNIIYAQDHMPLQAGERICLFRPWLMFSVCCSSSFLLPVSVGCHVTFLLPKCPRRKL